VPRAYRGVNVALVEHLQPPTFSSGLAILTYTAEPGSKSHEGLNLLGTSSATIDEADAAETSERA